MVSDSSNNKILKTITKLINTADATMMLIDTPIYYLSMNYIPAKRHPIVFNLRVDEESNLDEFESQLFFSFIHPEAILQKIVERGITNVTSIEVQYGQTIIPKVKELEILGVDPINILGLDYYILRESTQCNLYRFTKDGMEILAYNVSMKSSRRELNIRQIQALATSFINRRTPINARDFVYTRRTLDIPF